MMSIAEATFVLVLITIVVAAATLAVATHAYGEAREAKLEALRNGKHLTEYKTETLKEAINIRGSLGKELFALEERHKQTHDLVYSNGAMLLALRQKLEPTTEPRKCPTCGQADGVEEKRAPLVAAIIDAVAPPIRKMK